MGYIGYIGGRLSKADIQSSAKHQLILPGKHHVVQTCLFDNITKSFTLVQNMRYQQSGKDFGLSVLESVNEGKKDQMNLS